VRIDATAVESHIRKPTDNQLLYDCVRVLSLLLQNLRTIVDFAMTDHRRRAKKRHTQIRNARRQARRDPVYGHKLFLTCGKTSLITDCVLERGNPADATRLQPMLERQNRLYGRYPRQAAIDGGFSSRENLNWTARNEAGIKDMSFSKKCRLKVSDMVKSPWVYQQLKKFRAGVEGCISFFKRGFGGGRCDWNRWEGFQQYVHLSVLSYNLLVLARLRLA